MLNFDVTKKCLVGEGWCPIFAKSQVRNNTFNLNHYDHSFLTEQKFQKMFLTSTCISDQGLFAACHASQQFTSWNNIS
jgi:hypothetical protein